MKQNKSREQRLQDLKDHSTLLLESCERFRELHKMNKIRNIASKLRILVCRGQGNNLLFELAGNETLKILVLTRYIQLSITEVEPITNNLVQEKTIRKLFTIEDRATLPIITNRRDFSPWLEEINFEEWLESGVLMDWQTPSEEISTLSPRKLIKAYADTEASHSDKSFAKEFGGPVEVLKESYTFSGETIVMPLVYNYLYQIGQETAKLALEFCEHNYKK